MKAAKIVQQTAENIHAWATHYGLCLPDPAVTMAYKNIFPWTKEFQAALWARLTKDHRQATPEVTFFSVDPFPIHPSHRIDDVEVTGKRSYRENYPWASVQVVEHRSLAGGGAFEVDIDEENPNWGTLPAMAHALRMLKRRVLGGQTNPYVIRKALLRRGIEVPLVD